MVGDVDVAQDLVQDVFCKFWEKQPQLEIKISLKAYLYKSVFNHSLNYLKKVKRTDEREALFYSSAYTEQNNVESQLDLKETNLLVQRAIDSLPSACRAVFVLSRFEQMSHKEIAVQLDISTKTVENQIGKALKHLRKYLILLVVTIIMQL
jgi:RNA polymerase sigma-70 factor (ECF subfamily)